MKKTIVTVLMVSVIVATLATSVSAGTKKADSFTLKSQFINKIETVKITSGQRVHYDLQVGTDAVKPKTFTGIVREGSKILQSGSGYLGLTWRASKMGYVSGKVDNVKIYFTDK